MTGKILADPRKFRQIAARREQAFDALRQTFDNTGGAPIGAHPELILSLDFKEFGGLIEHGRDFRILHRHRSAPLGRSLFYADAMRGDLMQIRVPACHRR